MSVANPGVAVAPVSPALLWIRRILTVLTAVQLAFVGVGKVFGLGPVGENMTRLGFGSPAMQLIGFVELAGALALFAPSLRNLALVGLLLLFSGAIAVHPAAGDAIGQTMPAIVTFCVLALLLALYNPTRLRALLFAPEDARRL